MIETILLNYIKANTTATVGLEVPSTYQNGDLVVIQKTSSSMADRIETSVFAIQCYGDSLFKAASLNESVKDMLLNNESTDFVAKLNTDGEYNDTTHKRYRYQAVYEITSIGGR